MTSIWQFYLVLDPLLDLTFILKMEPKLLNWFVKLGKVHLSDTRSHGNFEVKLPKADIIFR